MFQFNQDANAWYALECAVHTRDDMIANPELYDWSWMADEFSDDNNPWRNDDKTVYVNATSAWEMPNLDPDNWVVMEERLDRDPRQIELPLT